VEAGRTSHGGGTRTSMCPPRRAGADRRRRVPSSRLLLAIRLNQLRGQGRMSLAPDRRQSATVVSA
jgi:hypothetical protein